MTVAGPWITGWYTDAVSISSVTHGYFWIAAWGWGAYGLVMSVNAAFNGSGRPLPGVVISSMRVIGLLLPLIWVGQAVFGLPGIFVAVCVSNLLLGWGGWLWLGRHIDRAEARAVTSPAD